MVIRARRRDLGDGFVVRRVLPSPQLRMVGPFAFVDHMGPVELEPGHGLDVRPHPHIGLSTVTFLFDGELVHRDSLGVEQAIRPGDVNWMTAGRGIVHSERSSAAQRKSGARVHGMQLWVALPSAVEETEPSFQHHAAATIPSLEWPGVRLRVLAGAAYGAESPVAVQSPLFYVEAQLEAGATLALPDAAERAAYVVSGALSVGGTPQATGDMVVFADGEAAGEAQLRAHTPSRVMLLGGAPLDGPRHIWWNFVSSSEARIQAAARAWRAREFPVVPGDDQDFIPLPDEGGHRSE